jgi:NAD(P)-dependent dehydrogenase (short-subunit alcohol dehydrogenase family)
MFAANGWLVVGTVRTDRGRMGTRIDVQPAEMTRPADLARVMHHIQRQYGRLDVLVCNAGYGLLGPLGSLGYAQMRDQLATNTLAPAELTRLALPMLSSSSGTAVAVSSLVGLTGLPGYSLYAASKHALEGLYESLALEYAEGPVRFKLVEPSGVNTAFWTSIKQGTIKGQASMEPSRLDMVPNRTDQNLTPEQVATVIYRAACDRGPKLRYPVGLTRRLNLVKRLLPGRLYRRLLRRFII